MVASRCRRGGFAVSAFVFGFSLDRVASRCQPGGFAGDPDTDKFAIPGNLGKI